MRFAAAANCAARRRFECSPAGAVGAGVELVTYESRRGGGVSPYRPMTFGSHSGSPNSNPYFAPSSTTSANSGGPAAASSVISRKKCSNPPGLITSIILAGTSPAFHIECSSPRGFVMYPPGPSTTSRSPDRKPISPSVTIENSSSRVCRCGGTRTPRLERVLHYRDRAAGVGAPQLEDDAEPGNNFAGPALTRLYDGQRWRWWRAHVPSRSFDEHGCQ